MPDRPQPHRHPRHDVPREMWVKTRARAPGYILSPLRGYASRDTPQYRNSNPARTYGSSLTSAISLFSRLSNPSLNSVFHA